MADVTVSTTIEATPQRVWALVADLPRMGQYSPENEGATWLGGATSASVGARFKGSNRDGGRSWSTTGTVTRADPGAVLEFVVHAGPFKVSRWRYDLAATDGGCSVTESTEDLRSGLSRWLSTRATGVKDRGARNRETMTATLAALKAAAESSAAESSAAGSSAAESSAAESSAAGSTAVGPAGADAGSDDATGGQGRPAATARD